MSVLSKIIHNQKKCNLKKWILTISMVGIGLRVYHLLYDRSLWIDEIYLCSSFFHDGYIGLATKVLDYGQKAPIGFLWAVKFITSIFGYSEIAFRFIPFISGIISLILFIKVSKHFLQPYTQIIAITIFSLAPALIYHSTEIKQYATECLTTVIALYLFTIYNSKTDLKSKILWGIFGAILFWFSYSVLFILIGIAITLSIKYLKTKNYKSLIINIIPFFIWMISFLTNYLLFTYKHKDSEWVIYWFRTYDYFMPFPPGDLDQFKWFIRNLIQMMDYPLGLNWNIYEISNKIFKVLLIPFVPISLLFIGIFSLAKDKKESCSLLITPLLLLLLASGLELYPLRERFWIFISPILILFICFGFEYLNRKLIIKQGFLTIIFFMLIIGPAFQSSYYFFNPSKFYKHKKSFEREAFDYIDKNFKEGDLVYNYWNNFPGYHVYQQIAPYRFTAFQGKDYRFSVNNLHDYNEKLRMEFKHITHGKRLWLIYNTQFTTTIGDPIDQPIWYYKGLIPPVANLQQEVNKQGKLLKKIVYSDLTICLFDLTFK